MAKIDVYNSNKEVVSKVDLNPAVFGVEPKEHLFWDVVKMQLANRRSGTARTKTRAEVAGSGKKPFRQKGLGRARAGSVRSPIWRHGGRIFGPKPRSFAVKVNAKVKKLALRRSFSERVKDSSVVVLDSLALPDHKTKSFNSVLKALKLDGKLLVSVKDYDENIVLATGNMPAVILIKAASVNTYQVLDAGKLLFTKDALDEFVKRLA